MRTTDTRWGAYLAAAALGLAAALWTFPLALLTGKLPGQPPPVDDFLQHVIGQIYFLAQPWHWPLLQVQKLDPPNGVNIAFTDSIPLEIVLLKLLHPLWPQHWSGLRQGIGPWLGFAWVMQPVAAVFALRGAGERRLVPALAASVIALAMPTFLLRVPHAALEGHFLILLALGLYFRGMRRPGAAAALSGLLVAALFVHPYLMACVAAVSAAGVVTLLPGLAHRAAWRRTLPTIGLLLAGPLLVLLCAYLFGYTRSSDYPGGYGYYSMNLAAPLWPAESSLMPWSGFGPVEATGGQYEGFQYLGPGLLVLFGVTLARRNSRHWLAGAVRRHPGLVLMTLGLTAFAVSTHVFLFHRSLLALDAIPPGGRIFRATGRLFWPVAYLLLLTGVRGAALIPGAGLRVALLLGCAALQCVDSMGMRENKRQEARAQQAPLSVELQRLDAVMSHYRSVVLRPRFECGVADKATPLQAMYLAALRDLPVDSMYAARVDPAAACHPGGPSDPPHPLPDDALGIAHGPDRLALAQAWMQAGMHCARLGGFALCSKDPAPLSGLDRVQ